MRGKKAKTIRKAVYKDASLKTPRTYEVTHSGTKKTSQGVTIETVTLANTAFSLRAIYLAQKHAARRATL